MTFFQPNAPAVRRSTLALICVAVLACESKVIAQDGFAAARFVPERKDDFAFENDKVAFRIYGPALRDSTENSGVDCWLKRVDYPIIDKWYAGAEKGVSYHKDHGEGYDPYKVGDALGCGGLALWLDGKLAMSNVFRSYRIIENGPRQTVFEIEYVWDGLPKRYRELRTFTLKAGSQLFRAESKFFVDDKPQPVEVAIGVSTQSGKAKPVSDEQGRWVGAWQAVDGAGFGTGAIVEHGGRGRIVQLDKKTKKGNSHVLLVTPTDEEGRITWHAGFGWERAGEITSVDQWENYLSTYREPEANPESAKHQPDTADETQVEFNADGYDKSCGIDVTQDGQLIQVDWPLDSARRGRLTFDLTRNRPLIHTAAVSSKDSDSFQQIGNGLEPIVQLRVGNRDLEKRGGWTIFFDRMQRKPSEAFRAVVQQKRATVTSKARRVTLTIRDITAGPFKGHLRWTFFADNGFVLQEAVMKTERKDTAYLFDTGLVCRDTKPTDISWRDSFGPMKTEATEGITQPRHVAVRGRAVAAQYLGGSIGMFPPPHRYFYPLDSCDNLKNVWVGPNYGSQSSPFGFGIRHDPSGDNRYVPWFNAPPGTEQEMGVFLMFSDGTAAEVLKDIARLTRADRFAKLPGHATFTSHFHVEHTLDLLKQRKAGGYTSIVPSSMKQPQFWKYTLQQPADDWTKPDFEDSRWKSGQGGFGKQGTKGLKFGTLWTTSDIWLRRDFTLSQLPPNEAKLIIQHDEDAEVYLNGVLAATVTGFSPEYRDLPIRPEAMQTLREGNNVIAVHCWNDGGGQGIDVGLVVKEQSSDGIPPSLQSPGFVEMFKGLGIDIVHLAEFHNGRTPKLSAQTRLRQLETLHNECLRLSDDKLLLLPGEEPNVHLGGHWISFFPKPVYWVLNRPEGIPFVTEHPKLGRVYHVGGEADVFRLLREENGLAWTAHPRIKSSTGFPDAYRDRLFYQSKSFLGGAWKAMPADLSQPRLGSRVLDLLDDMSNWGTPKVVLGEVDVFKIEQNHELYAHMNVNYLRLDDVPKFGDGWQPVLDTLRGAEFFVTTGEVLIPEFTVNGKKSGEVASVTKGSKAEVRLDLKWTFPLAYAEIITGDGHDIKRHRVDLSATESFGEKSLKVDVDVTGGRWLRVEVWDVATNGAFTQPVWLHKG